MSKHTPDEMNNHILSEQDPKNESNKLPWPSLTPSQAQSNRAEQQAPTLYKQL